MNKCPQFTRVTRGVFHKGLRLVVRRVYSSQNPRTVRKSRTVRDSVSQRFPVAANCKYVQLTLSKPVRTRLEFSETDLRTVSGYDQFAVNSSQVEFLLRRTNILVKHPPGSIQAAGKHTVRMEQYYVIPTQFTCRWVNPYQLNRPLHIDPSRFD